MNCKCKHCWLHVFYLNIDPRKICCCQGSTAPRMLSSLLLPFLRSWCLRSISMKIWASRQYLMSTTTLLTLLTTLPVFPSLFLPLSKQLQLNGWEFVFSEAPSSETIFLPARSLTPLLLSQLIVSFTFVLSLSVAGASLFSLALFLLPNNPSTYTQTYTPTHTNTQPCKATVVTVSPVDRWS